MGVMFDVDDFTPGITEEQKAIVNTFFETLDYASDPPAPNVVALGALMNMVDFDNRYAFIGSLTTPPCTRDVYFNVLSTIYPVRQTDLDAFNDRLRPSGTNSQTTSGTNTAAGTGNFRKPQPYNGQDLIVISKPEPTLADSLADL